MALRIVAARHIQAVECARRLGVTDLRGFQFVHDDYHLRGIAPGSVVIFDETAPSHPEYQEILRFCETRELKVVRL